MAAPLLDVEPPDRPARGPARGPPPRRRCRRRRGRPAVAPPSRAAPRRRRGSTPVGAAAARPRRAGGWRRRGRGRRRPTTATRAAASRPSSASPVRNVQERRRGQRGGPGRRGQRRVDVDGPGARRCVGHRGREQPGVAVRHHDGRSRSRAAATYAASTSPGRVAPAGRPPPSPGPPRRAAGRPPAARTPARAAGWAGAARWSRLSSSRGPRAWDGAARRARPAGGWESRPARARTTSTATSSSGWRTEVSPPGTTWATCESSKPTTARSGPGRSPRSASACRTPIAWVSEAQTKAVGRASSRSTVAASRPLATASSTRQARPVVGRPRARIARLQPERRSSPIQDSRRQPIQAIRVWPRSRRCSVASSAPAAPSTSTHGCRASGLSQGRPKATKGARRSSSQTAWGLPRKVSVATNASTAVARSRSSYPDTGSSGSPANSSTW